MNRLIFVLFACAALASCGGFSSFSKTGQNSQLADNAFPIWDGNAVICNERVNFSRFSKAALPEYDIDERIGYCKLAMKYLALHRQYGDKTSYFGAAAAVTAALSAIYTPLLRQTYTPDTWALMHVLNLRLEVTVNQAAAELAAGNKGGPAFSNHVLENEQIGVQYQLDHLCAESPETYAVAIENVSRSLNLDNFLLLYAVNRDPFFAAYEASLASVRREIGGNIDFSNFDHRFKVGEALGRMIANISAEP